MIQPRGQRFHDLLAEAIKHFTTAGYTSEGDLQQWTMRLHYALDQEIPNDKQTREFVATLLTAVYRRDVDKLAVLKRVPGVTRYSLSMVEPHLRAELDRKIFAAVDLIKINAQKRKQQTLQRFAGWVSSVPPAGSSGTNLRDLHREMMTPSKQMKFEARRVAIDQGHKLSAAVAHIVASGNGAIAAIWHDRGERDRGYDARPAHLARSGKLFLIRDSWAAQQGLVRPGIRPYTDAFEHPAELPFCSCYYEYVTSPRQLPEETLTARGRLWIRGSAA